MDKIKKGIPFIVKLRTYLPHFIIGIIMLILYFILSLFIFESTSIAFIEINRANASKTTEIIISKEENLGETFYYLKNYFIGKNDNAISADILMTKENINYGVNDIYFEGTLENNSCAISRNIAMKNNIKVGDELTFISTNIRVKVSKILKPELGIDKEYKRDGIIIVNYDNNLLNRTYQFITFNDELEYYNSLVNLYRIKDWKTENIGIVIRNIIIFVISTIFSLFLCEIFIFKRRIKDYLIYIHLGKNRKKIFINIICENIIKYLIPIIIVYLFNLYLIMYGSAYLTVILILSILLIIITLIHSVIYILRVS